MVKISIGTAGFSYKDWVNTFYPKKLQNVQYLEYFSKFFNLVEINSSFYNLPSEDMVNNWNDRVSEKFRFIVKVWKQISHNLDDQYIDSHILEFFSRLNKLKSKIAGFLIQFPPWFKYSENHLQKLELLLKKMPSKYKYIIELRDNSWFNSNILSKISDGKNVITGTTYMPKIIPYYIPNQSFYYIRMIGDRELTAFNRIQRSQDDAINDLVKNVKNLIKTPNISEIFIIVNNHFQGFAPESVNIIKKKFGLPYRHLKDQKSLTDFLL